MTGYLLYHIDWLVNHENSKWFVVLDKQDAFEVYMSLCEEEAYDQFCANCDFYWVPGNDKDKFFYTMVNMRERETRGCWFMKEVPIYGNFSG